MNFINQKQYPYFYANLEKKNPESYATHAAGKAVGPVARVFNQTMDHAGYVAGKATGNPCEPLFCLVTMIFFYYTNR